MFLGQLQALQTGGNSHLVGAAILPFTDGYDR